MKTILLSVLTCTLLCFGVKAQRIVYADTEKEDVQRMNFEILGKAADNYLIYKEAGGKHRISVYDYNMQLRENIPITMLPGRDALLDLSFFKTGRQFYLLYQYQEGDVVYLKAAAIEANGRILNEPVTLDTTMIAYKTDNRIYNTLSSNDNTKLIAFRINKRDRKLFRFTAKLFDTELQPVGESRFSLPMEYKGDYLTGYSIANDGSFSFVKYHREANGNIVEASFIEKPAASDEYSEHKLNVDGIFLDDIKTMVDDVQGRYLLSSLYSTRKRGDIEGLYVFGIEKGSGKVDFEKTTLFDDDLKARAKGRSNGKNAFNNFFINNIILKDDGGFTVSAEALYNTNGWDRWGYWGGPYWGGFGWGGPGFWGGWGPGWGWGWNRMGGWWPYSYYSPFFYRSYWWGGWGPGWGGPYGGAYSQEFNAENIAVISFDSEGNKTWDNVIVKSQSESNTDGNISYQVLPGSTNTSFLMNNPEKISRLETVIINNNGTVQKGEAIQAKDKRMDFMPKYGKQTGERELIIPYLHKKNIGFARVEL